MSRHLSPGLSRTIEIVSLAMAGAFTIGMAVLWFGHTPPAL
jgi:hypothetical protein